MQPHKKKNLLQNPIILSLIALLRCALWGSATPAIKTGYSLLEIEGILLLNYRKAEKIK